MYTQSFDNFFLGDFDTISLKFESSGILECLCLRQGRFHGEIRIIFKHDVYGKRQKMNLLPSLFS